MGMAAASEFPGVTWQVRAQRWYARATVGGKRHYLGSYRSELDAARATTKFWTELIQARERGGNSS